MKNNIFQRNNGMEYLVILVMLEHCENSELLKLNDMQLKFQIK